MQLRRRRRASPPFAHVSAPLADLRRVPAGQRRRHADGPGRALLPARRLARRWPTRSRGIGRGDDWVWIGGVKGYMDGSLGSTTALFFSPTRRSRRRRRAHARPRTRCAPGSAPPIPPASRSWCTPSASGPTACCSRSSTAWRRPTGRATAASGSSTRSTSGRRTSPRFGRAGRDRLDAAVPRDRRRTLGGEAASAPSGSRRPTPSGRCSTRAAILRLRLRLDRRADRSARSGIYAAVTRRTLDGKNPGGWIPEQKITVEEALRAYTAGNAYGDLRRGPTGASSSPGYLADLVLLDRDLTGSRPRRSSRRR